MPLAKNRSFLSLTSAQFLGAANDHLFKMVVSLLAVKTAAADSAGFYLSMSAAVFIVPYLLFSGYAGHLADRLPKRSVLVACKFAEVAIMAVATLAMMNGIGAGGLLVVLFLMAAHSTFFSPCKYGSVAEIVPASEVARANGILEASRYGAVILGTAAGGFLMEVWGATPVYIGAGAVLVAVAGWVCSLGIAHVPAAGSKQQWPNHPWTTLVQGMSRLRQSRSLAVAVASITYFEAIAALIMLDVLLVAKIEFGIGDAAAGTLGGFAAIGTAAGALLYGRFSGRRIELGFAPLAGLCIAAALIALGVLPHSYESLAGLLFLLGIFGGLFFVPFLAWLQTHTRADEKGVILSTNNFLNMVGVLGASAALWLLHDGLGLTPSAIFLVSAGTTVAFVFALLGLSVELRSHVGRFLERARRKENVGSLGSLASEHANA